VRQTKPIRPRVGFQGPGASDLALPERLCVTTNRSAAPNEPNSGRAKIRISTVKIRSYGQSDAGAASGKRSQKAAAGRRRSVTGGRTDEQTKPIWRRDRLCEAEPICRPRWHFPPFLYPIIPAFHSPRATRNEANFGPGPVVSVAGPEICWRFFPRSPIMTKPSFGPGVPTCGPRCRGHPAPDAADAVEH
jgi:hypothetical protein